MTTILAGVQTAAPVGTIIGAQGTASGSMEVGGSAYLYHVTYVNSWGETTSGTVSAQVATTTGSVNLSAIPVSADEEVVARRLYRTADGGSSFLLLDEIPATGTTYTDIIADEDLGAAMPTANTAYSSQVIKGEVSFGMPVKSVTAAVAAAGTNAATAALIPASTEVAIVSGASGTSGVKLPATVLNRQIIVKNSAANDLLLYPATGELIEGAASFTVEHAVGLIGITGGWAVLWGYAVVV